MIAFAMALLFPLASCAFIPRIEPNRTYMFVRITDWATPSVFRPRTRPSTMEHTMYTAAEMPPAAFWNFLLF